jgi:hypothetical protein
MEFLRRQRTFIAELCSARLWAIGVSIQGARARVVGAVLGR